MSAWAVPGYTEERELGRGASGRVVAATSSATGQRVAIKYLSATMLGDPEYMARFRMEARLLTQLDVPEIVRLFAYREQPGAGAAIVMELVDGVSLHEMISRQGPTSPESALVVLKGSLLGLAAAHSVGVVHRDYKPENVLVDATGQSKLADFGVAVRAGERAPVAGTPLYMAPEQWAGAPASPATDIYAATAVFYECLTGRTPFSGRLRQLREQHENAPVPSQDVAEPLRRLVERGMAKNPAARAADAAAFVAELESTAATSYGPDWEWRGRAQLAARASALLLLLLRRPTGGPAAATDAVTWFLKTTLRRRRKALIAATAVITAAGLAIAGTAIASQSQLHHVSGGGGGAGAGGGNHTVVHLPPDKQAVLAAATTTPPAAAGSCKGPTAFKYAATLTASQRGPVTFRWVYSPTKQTKQTKQTKKAGSPQLGPLHTVQFAAAGARLVSGGEVKQTTAGTGWAEIEVVSPVKETSNKASYRLLCKASQPGHRTVIATATVVPQASKVTCGSAPPSFTFAGSVSSTKAGPVTYYWALGDGATTTPATLRFAAAGTMSVQPLLFTPQTDSATGNAVIVVTSPEAAVSNTATFTLSCQGHTGTGGTGGGAHLSVSASARVTPASSTVGCSFGPSTFTFTGTITANQATTVTYYWALSSGAGQVQTLTFAQPGTQPVAPATFTPPTDSYSGAGEIIITSPATSPPAPPSNKVTFTQSCTSATLHVTSNSLPTAIQHAAYSATLSAAGGKAPYTWKATDLPAGLTISPSGVVSGTTSASPGNYNVTVTVADSEAGTTGTARNQQASPSAQAAKTASASLTLTVKAPAFPALQVTTATLPAGTQGTAYDYTAAATGGNGDYAWSATGLPGGLTMSAGGVLSGTPQQGGNYSVVLTVGDGGVNPPASSPALTLTVAYPGLQITTTNLPEGTQGAVYDPADGFTVAATGGNGDYTWSATGLPDGLTMSAAGVLSGTPTKADSYGVVLTVADGGVNPPASSPVLALTVTAPVYPPLAITTASLPNGTAGAAYAPFQVVVSGGSGQYAWTPGDVADGLSISAAGVISGTPTAAGNFSVTVTVTDSVTGKGQSATLPLVVEYPPVSITSTQTDLDGANFNELCTAPETSSAITSPQYAAPPSCPHYQLVAAGGSGAYTWTASTLPPGVTLSAAGLLTDAIPDSVVDCSYTVQITLTDSADSDNTVVQSFTMGDSAECG